MTIHAKCQIYILELPILCLSYRLHGYILSVPMVKFVRGVCLLYTLKLNMCSMNCWYLLKFKTIKKKTSIECEVKHIGEGGGGGGGMIRTYVVGE